MDLAESTPFTQLRLLYLRYQDALHHQGSSSSVVNDLLHQVVQCLQKVLDSVDTTTSVNLMITSRARAILTGNSPLCLNQGVLGVILPFYGSSSFLNPIVLSKTDKESFNEIHPLVNALSSNSPSLSSLLASQGLDKEFIDHLCNNPSSIASLNDFFTSDEDMLDYYSKLVSKLVCENPFQYIPLLLSLHKSLARRSNPPISFVLQLTLVLLQLQQDDPVVSLLAAIPPEDFIKTVHTLYPYFVHLPTKQATDCIHSVSSALTTLILQWKKEINDSTFALFLNVDSLTSQYCAELVRWIIDDVAETATYNLPSFSLVFDSLYLLLVLGEIVAEVNPSISSDFFNETLEDLYCPKCPISALRHILYAFICTHSFFSSFGHNTCCSQHGAFLLYELQLILWWPDSSNALYNQEINQVLRCALSLSVLIYSECNVDCRNTTTQCVGYLPTIVPCV